MLQQLSPAEQCREVRVLTMMLRQDFVREILREQPENIYNFGARYFAELANPVSCVSMS